MRQLFVYVPRGSGERVAEIAAELKALNTVVLQGTRDGNPVDVVATDVSNRRVGPFLERVEALEDVHVSFFPMGALVLKPPPEEAADQVTDVEPLSPIEVYLAGHQSVGSWRGFLGYAAVAGAVVWVGLYTGSSYLLTAAMLVAPFAGPAMNAAIATASGETFLLRRSLIRYVAALAVTVLVTLVLTWLIGPSSPSPRMIAESQVSAVAVLLPLVAGAAGALYLLTSERSSLVSGAAVGLLVAASLAPPAGLVGMGMAIGRWDMVGSAAYVLTLQLVGIHFTGALVLRLFGLTHEGSRFGRNARRLFPAGITATLVLLGALLFVQFRDPIELKRSTVAQNIATAIDREMAEGDLRAEQVRAEFLRTVEGGPPILLAEVFLRRPDASVAALDSAARAISDRIQRRIARDWPTVSPMTDVRWVSAP